MVPFLEVSQNAPFHFVSSFLVLFRFYRSILLKEILAVSLLCIDHDLCFMTCSLFWKQLVIAHLFPWTHLNAVQSFCTHFSPWKNPLALFFISCAKTILEKFTQCSWLFAYFFFRVIKKARCTNQITF